MCQELGEEGETGADTWLQAVESKRKFQAGADDANEALSFTGIVLRGISTKQVGQCKILFTEITVSCKSQKILQLGYQYQT